MVWPLVRPTQDTAVLVNAALETLKAIYRPGFNYAKAGVMLMDLMPEGFAQGELDWSAESLPITQAAKDRSKVMAAIDSLNTRYGRGTVKLASGGTEHARLIKTGTPPPGWKMKQQRRTPRYTTHWQELAVVKG
jgi:DNA polymerase V